MDTQTMSMHGRGRIILGRVIAEMVVQGLHGRNARIAMNPESDLRQGLIGDATLAGDRRPSTLSSVKMAQHGVEHRFLVVPHLTIL
ncbi:hypothetical protein BGV60_23150 [Burkholderia ubonensis]|nr:hypothetical protein WJ79_12550 [Burkholderia ubonensis]KVP17845.1 hypothetical protein WJ84_13715 [Burkholderia ubonensis]OJB49756.1 hypothetical protein BGV60_23150 [Burkholderia ubonensis]OJB51594.1 hypothetical protein BGV59_11405 [Burkholderia ubonensis]